MDRDKADEIKQHFDVVAEGLRSEIRAVDVKGDRRSDDLGRRFEAVAGDLRSELGDKIEGVRAELRAEIGGVRAELGAEIRDVKRHTDVVAEGLRSEIRLVAEGVVGLDQKFTQEFVMVREEIREQIGEVKSLLRGSYDDLDRRMKPS